MFPSVRTYKTAQLELKGVGKYFSVSRGCNKKYWNKQMRWNTNLPN